MNPFTRFRCLCVTALALSWLAALAGCGSSEESPESFSVRFVLEQVPAKFTLDSLEVRMVLGEEEVQGFTIDWKTGTSRTTVLSHPGQAYSIAYVFYASGYDIGRGTDTGAFTEDMRVELSPQWDPFKVEAARVRRDSGVLLPPDLSLLHDLARKDHPFEFQVDSVPGLLYTWYVRALDSVMASGTGARLSWTPPGDLATASVNVKFVVKDGNRVLEERAWDVKLLTGRVTARLDGVITRNNPTSTEGTYTHFAYNSEGQVEEVTIQEGTKPEAGGEAVSRIQYTYAKILGEAGKVATAIRQDLDGVAESTFTYDSRGRLAVLSVATGFGTQVDSIGYPLPDLTVTSSRFQGTLVRLTRGRRLSPEEEIDSVYALAGDSLVLSALIQYRFQSGRPVLRRAFRRMMGEMQPLESETRQYNGLGDLARLRVYREGGTLRLEQSETFQYDSKDGLLRQAILIDETTGDYLRVRDFRFIAGSQAKRGLGIPPSPAAQGFSEEGPDADLKARLAAIERLVPRTLPTPSRPPRSCP